MPDDTKRKYTFKNQAYWESVKGPRKSAIDTQMRDDGPAWEPASTSFASSGSRGGGASTLTRRNNVTRNLVSDDKNLLRELQLPYVVKNGRISMKDSIQLCQKVYANIAIFRNTIDIMTEFSSAEIYLTGGNEASRTFTSNWMEKAQIPKFKDMYFREYFRSGNVFVYRFDGRYTEEDFKKLKTSYAAKKNTLPIRYTILNPADIVIFSAAAFENAPYRKVLNEWELEQIRMKRTEEDRMLYNALPEDVKKLIDTGKWGTEGIYIPLDVDKIYAIFYKKQPYEPFAVPFGYPVLRDLNHKEELKQIDQAISRCIDNVILFVTMGDKKDNFGNGMNPVAMQKMQELLSNESVGRVLVSDYSTKAEWAIPDIGEILNPLKYQIVNEDIREGLLNVMMGSDKYANAAMKTQIFLERLNEGRKVFLNEFLQKEINNVCKAMGFKSIPKANFQDVDLKDEVQYAKIYTRLMEIGVLTPEQGIRAMETGIYPEAELMSDAQKVYVEERKEGKYNPLLGGVPMAISPDAEANRKIQKELGDAKNQAAAQKAGASNPNSTTNGRPTGSKGPKATSTPSPTGTSKADVQNPVSVSKFRDNIQLVSSLMSQAEAKVKEKYSLTELSEPQKNLVFRLTQNVISYANQADWNTRLAEVMAEPEKYLTSFARNEVSDGVEEIAAQHGIDTYSAALLYHSKFTS